tara:strand:+ start:1053 stop:1280 length:228 start_codon:yes stop_codon:yes gene_type:complete
MLSLPLTLSINGILILIPGLAIRTNFPNLSITAVVCCFTIKIALKRDAMISANKIIDMMSKVISFLYFDYKLTIL